MGFNYIERELTSDLKIKTRTKESYVGICFKISGNLEDFPTKQWITKTKHSRIILRYDLNGCDIIVN